MLWKKQVCDHLSCFCSLLLSFGVHRNNKLFWSKRKGSYTKEMSLGAANIRENVLCQTCFLFLFFIFFNTQKVEFEWVDKGKSVNVGGDGSLSVYTGVSWSVT